VLKAVIVDDEENAIDALRFSLAKCGGVDVAATFTDPAEALDALRAHADIDVVFLDIEMPGIRGLELAAMLPDVCPNAEVVFTTAYDQYAVEAFEVNALDYLLKPVRLDRLEKTLARLAKRAGGAAHGTPGPDREPGEGRIACFGMFRLLVGTSPLQQVKWRTSKARELFAYLVHHRGTFVHKEKIVEDIWPNQEKERALGYLHTCIYQIRKTIRSFRLEERMRVTYNNDAYGLLMHGIPCDAEEFLRLAERRDPAGAETVADWERAVQLYGGHYFEEDDFPWADPHKQRLLNVYLELVRALADHYMRSGRPDQAASHLRELLAKDPLHEEAHRRLLECLAEIGDRAALVQHYRAMERLFREELGVAPSPETEALFRRLS